MARPKPPGRPLEPVSNAGSRGMIVAPKPRASARGEGGQNSAYGPLRRAFFIGVSQKGTVPVSVHVYC
jgi:hypothetical protein